MKKGILVVIALALMLTVASLGYTGCSAEHSAKSAAEHPAEAEASKAFGGVIVELAEMKAEVVAVDHETRLLTLKDEAGNIQTVEVSDIARNLGQVEVGDNLHIQYTGAVQIIVTDEKVEPGRSGSVEIKGAPLGEKPAGTIEERTLVNATVLDINYDERTVVLKGPIRTLEIQASEKVERFNQIKVGDTVVLEYIGLVAIQVTE